MIGAIPPDVLPAVMAVDLHAASRAASAALLPPPPAAGLLHPAHGSVAAMLTATAAAAGVEAADWWLGFLPRWAGVRWV